MMYGARKQAESVPKESGEKAKLRMQELQTSLRQLSEVIEQLGPETSNKMMENLYNSLLNLNEEVELLKSVIQYNQAETGSSVLQFRK